MFSFSNLSGGLQLNIYLNCKNLKTKIKIDIFPGIARLRVFLFANAHYYYIIMYVVKSIILFFLNFDFEKMSSPELRVVRRVIEASPSTPKSAPGGMPGSREGRRGRLSGGGSRRSTPRSVGGSRRVGRSRNAMLLSAERELFAAYSGASGRSYHPSPRERDSSSSRRRRRRSSGDSDSSRLLFQPQVQAMMSPTGATAPAASSPDDIHFLAQADEEHLRRLSQQSRRYHAALGDSPSVASSVSSATSVRSVRKLLRLRKYKHPVRVHCAMCVRDVVKMLREHRSEAAILVGNSGAVVGM